MTSPAHGLVLRFTRSLQPLTPPASVRLLRYYFQDISTAFELRRPPSRLSSLCHTSYADDTHRLLLRTIAQLAAATKICPQPRQSAAATKRVTNMASSDTDDDVILIAGVLLAGAFVNERKKKLISANEAFGLVDG